MKMWRIPKIWEGAEVWIIGGGASIPMLFGVPTRTIEKVWNGQKDISAYSPYLSPIHNRHVLGVNMAFRLGNWLSGMYFGDRSFFKKTMTELPDFRKLKITHARLHKDDLPYHWDIKYLRIDTKRFGISDDPAKIRWNKNSGNAAINVAALAGAKRILLLGFDGVAIDTGQTHWHGAYGNYRIKKPSFDRFAKPLPEIARDAKKMKVEILNVNPRSAIETFPKVSLKEVL